jgi:acyl-coenzyme A synthetase/AMP-(fatty) acid ligase
MSADSDEVARAFRYDVARGAVCLHRVEAGPAGQRGRSHGVVQAESGELQMPAYVVFTELPKTSTGKIQKFKLREMAKEA